MPTEQTSERGQIASGKRCYRNHFITASAFPVANGRPQRRLDVRGNGPPQIGTCFYAAECEDPRLVSCAPYGGASTQCRADQAASLMPDELNCEPGNDYCACTSPWSRAICVLNHAKSSFHCPLFGAPATSAAIISRPLINSPKASATRRCRS